MAARFDAAAPACLADAGEDTLPAGQDQALPEKTGDALSETRLLQVAADGHGVRLDKLLSQKNPEFSRSYLQQLIEAGLVHRNGQTCNKASARLQAGDSLQVELRATAQSQAFVPQDIALDLVYEDSHLAVINKPAGLVVHPAPGNWSGTLLNALLHRYPDAASLPRAGIVHRLDKDTSGLMVVARTRASMDWLVQQIAARAVQREYWALAHGLWRKTVNDVVTVDAAIGRDPRNRLRMAVVDLARHNGKAARTDFRLIGNHSGGLAGGASACWVQARLHTGRTHQIRVHMQQLGHPLLADALYGGAPAYGMQRQALHAFRLTLPHPQTQQTLQCEAPLPPDMQQALVQMQLQAPPLA